MQREREIRLLPLPRVLEHLRHELDALLTETPEQRGVFHECCEGDSAFTRGFVTREVDEVDLGFASEVVREEDEEDEDGENVGDGV